MTFIQKAFFLSSFFYHTSVAQKIYQGFNSGNTLTNYAAKTEDDFTKEFTTMHNLHDSPGVFNSVRLYTNIQQGTVSEPLSAFPAALKTNTSMLLGIWCSGTNNITNELNALSAAIDQYGADFAKAVIAISVGSEDLYRLSADGIKQNAGIGTGPKQIVKFIDDTRNAIKGTLLADKPVGHVDTWKSWANHSNAAVIEAVDWIGVDIYPFFENDTTVSNYIPNTFDNAVPIFEDRYNRTVKAAQGKPVWVTETGWPFEGPGWGESVSSVDNQRGYWQGVGCGELFGRVNTWWYTLRDANPESQQKFAITDDSLSTTASFDLSCPAGDGAPATVNTSSAGKNVPRAVVLQSLAACFMLALFVC